MTDLNNLSDADLESQLTNDVVREATGTAKADATADQKQTPAPKDPNPADKKDPEPVKKDDGKDTDPKDTKDQKREVPKSIETLLAKKNEEKRLKEQYKGEADKANQKVADLEKQIAELKNPKDDDKMSDDERSQKLAEAISKKAIAEDRRDESLEKSKSIDTVDESKRTEEIGKFFNENPETLANKEELMDLAKSYPTLPMDQVNKLYIANSDPMKLLSEQDVNKIKGGFNLAGNFDKSNAKGKNANDMSDDELESSLNESFKSGANPING